MKAVRTLALFAGAAALTGAIAQQAPPAPAAAEAAARSRFHLLVATLADDEAEQ